MVKLKLFTIVTFLLLSVVSAKAYDFKDNGCYYTIKSMSDLTVALTNSGETTKDEYGYDKAVPCYKGDFTVPQTVQYSGKTFTVTQIEGNAFDQCVLGKLIIPPSVTNATIAAMVQDLVIEDSNVAMEELYASGAKNVYVGRDVDNYNCYSFAYSSWIQKAVFGNNVTSIPSYMFEECENLEIVEIPASVKRIQHHAFARCKKLKNIKADGVEVIEREAFSCCIALESFSFPSLHTIESGNNTYYAGWSGAFQGCISLKNLEFSEGIRQIGALAFSDCESLERIQIPATIDIIGNEYQNGYSYAFANCPKLKEISIAKNTPIQIDENTFNPQTYINATLKVPVEALEAYKTANIWKNFFNIVGDSTLKPSICLVDVYVDIYSDCGSVEFLDKVVDYQNKKASGKIQYGGDVTLKFNPKKGYCIGEVIVNGEDYTSAVSENKLVISNIEGNIKVEVRFAYEPIYLTLKQADSGALKMEINSSLYKFYILPSNGYEVHSISLNGQDITSSMKSDNSITLSKITENSELIVTYKGDGTNGINTVKSNSLVKVYGAYGRIVISNASMGETIGVYDLSGRLIDSVTVTSIETMIDVIDNTVYIVKVGNETFKVGI